MVILATFIFKRAIDCPERHLKIAKELGDMSGDGTAYGYLSFAHHSLVHFKRAIDYLERYLKISEELGYRLGEGLASSPSYEGCSGFLGQALLPKKLFAVSFAFLLFQRKKMAERWAES